MPLARRIATVSDDDLRLEERLYDEWAHPTDGGEPIIIEEADPARLRPTHLYVIWGEWEGLPQVDRSAMIMNAYEKLRGRDLALSVSVAMGLTPSEAQRLGIEYQSVGEPA